MVENFSGPVSMQSVYVETSIISYLRSRPSPQVIVAAHQLQTRRWWEAGRREFRVVISQ